MAEPAAGRPVAALRTGPLEFAMLGGIGLLWGANFTLIKVGVGDIPPVTLTFARMALGALLLIAVAAARGVAWPRDLRTWALLFALAVFGAGLPQGLIAWSEQTIDSGLAAILMALMPVGAMLIAHAMTRDERLRWRTAAGIGLGFGAMVVLVGADALSGLGHAVGPELAAAAAALCYSLNAVLARRVSHLPALVVGAVSLGFAALYSLPVALIFERPWTIAPSTEAVVAIVALGLVGTGAAALLYFALINRAGATFLALSNYLVPLVGVAFGALFLGEALRAQAWVAMAMVLGGLALARR
ncbi:MAG: DMT family transporter [Alphaproteobacteria bacterium]